MFCSTDAGQWEVHTTGFQAHLPWSQGFRIACIHLKGFQCFWVSDCSHEIKLHLLFGRKAMTNIDSMLKSRDVTLLTKVHLVKSMVFPVVMYGCESWTIKKAEHQRINAFELWCWRRLLRIPWTGRRSSQSILKEISPEYSLEELMLQLKLQYFGHLIWITDWFEKTLMLGKIEGRRRTRWQRMRRLDGITNLMLVSLKKTPGVGDGQRSLACCSPGGCRESDTIERLNSTGSVLYQSWDSWINHATARRLNHWRLRPPNCGWRLHWVPLLLVLGVVWFLGTKLRLLCIRPEPESEKSYANLSLGQRILKSVLLWVHVRVSQGLLPYHQWHPWGKCVWDSMSQYISVSKPRMCLITAVDVFLMISKSVQYYGWNKGN